MEENDSIESIKYSIVKDDEIQCQGTLPCFLWNILPEYLDNLGADYIEFNNDKLNIILPAPKFYSTLKQSIYLDKKEHKKYNAMYDNLPDYACIRPR